MATVVFDGTRVSTADALGSVWLDLGGKAANLEPDFVYQRTSGTDGSVSEKVGTSELGIKYYDSATSHDFTTGHASGVQQTALYKVIATNKDVLNVEGSTGGILEIGSGDRTNYYRYYVIGSDTYPKAGGWLVIPINPNISGYVDATPASAPTLTAIDMYAWACTFSGSSKSQNVAMDAIDFIPNGKGLTLTGTAGVFQDYADFDEGTLSNSYGICTTKEGVFYSLGTLTVGSATLTTFTDSNQVVVFPGGRFAAGFCGIAADLQNASTAVSMTNCVFKGAGVDGTTDQRPVYATTGTSGTDDRTGSTFNVFASITLTSACDYTDCIMISGDLVDAGSGATLAGASILTSTAAADSSALRWNVALDPDGELDNMTFTIGSLAHHAIEFGTSSPLTMTMRGMTATGFNASDAQNDSTFHVLRTSGTVTINVIGGTGNFSYKSAGATVNIVIDPVTTTVKILDGRDNSNLQNARVILKASDGTGDLDFETSVTITRVTTTATVAHTAHPYIVGNKVEIKGANQPEYNGPQTITAVLTNSYDFTVAGSPTTPATGTIISTGIVLEGLTDANGEIADTRTWSLAQPVTGVARKSTTSPFFVAGNLTGTISTTLGLSITQALTLDE